MKLISRSFMALVGACAFGGTALAEGRFLSDGLTEEEATKQYVVDVGIAGVVSPKYDGADDYIIYPFPIISFAKFYLPGIGEVKDGVTKKGVFLYPSFGYVGGRSPNDDPKLAGTKKINWAGEVGLGAGFRYDWFRAFLEVRRGFNGYNGFVGRAGMDAIFEPHDRWTLSVGPRVDFADDNYFDTYFGMPGSFDPDGGFKSVGAVARVSFEATEDVSLHLQGGYDRLIGDAEDSPVTVSDDQFTAAFGVTYRFDFDLWK
ncbi:MipA/OmpV family protein [Rhodobacteraceae bacterium RKSG542]|uniref:MipA/OmpV family protein n=1 Tax=Pseudovibrio flavus TaxID=2529854 RepID=UPI0012BB92D0|nr:MipA/OmpV family protein [Pseudovibrio flavus]MTI18314.1 MipA/OmpV family protein [Pseudovibrio flavus]